MGATANVLNVCLGGLALYLVSRLVCKRNAPLPPGPPGWPLIGNLLDFPTYAPYRTFASLSGKYGKCIQSETLHKSIYVAHPTPGPVMSFNVLGAKYVVLNSVKAIKDLLDKDSAVTSNRLHLTMGGELVGWKDSTVLLQYGDTYRKHRRFFHRQIGTKSSLEVFHPAQEEEARQLVRNVLKNPDNVIAHCCRYGLTAHKAIVLTCIILGRMARSVILKISHGYSVKDDGDPLVEMAGDAMNVFTMIITPGRFLVDTVPMCMFPTGRFDRFELVERILLVRYLPEWFPGGGFHKDAKRWRKIVRETADTPHQLVLEHLVSSLRNHVTCGLMST